MNSASPGDDTHDRRKFLQRAVGAAMLGALVPDAVAHAIAPTPSNMPTTMHSRSRDGALPKLVLPHPSGAVVEIYLQGAHVTSWKRANGDELLFLSAKSSFAAGLPIRGGIPVVFPQFANLGPLPMHGVLRTVPWDLVATGVQAAGAVFAQFASVDTPSTRAVWPHRFKATLVVALDDALSTTITIDNVGDTAFPFQSVLHTYLRVGDVRQVTIDGLEGASYLDRSADGAARVEPVHALAIDGEVDRLYPGYHAPLRVVDHSRGRVILLDHTGFTDTVVWNPGEIKGRTPINLAEGEYLQMLAVEGGVITSPLRLEPGHSWTGTQRLRIA